MGIAMIYDAHLPSMTARFRIPPGLPFSSGVYSLEFLRVPTAADHALWSHLPEPTDDLAIQDALEAMVSAFDAAASSPRQREALAYARTTLEQSA